VVFANGEGYNHSSRSILRKSNTALCLYRSFLKQGSDDDSDSDSDDSKSDNDDDKDSINWDSNDDSSSSSDSDGGGGAYKELQGRAKWLKKVPAEGKKPKSKPAPIVDDVDKPDSPKKKETKVTSKDHAAIRAPKSVIPEEGLTAAVLNKKVQEIASQRGRRGTDPRQLLRQFEGLSRLSMRFGPRVEIPVLMYVISAQFGLQHSIDDYMDTPTWRACATYLERISKVIVDDGYRLGVQSIDEADLVLGAKASRMKAAASTGDEGALEAVAADEKLLNPHTGEEETENQRAERQRVEKENAMSEEEKKTIPVVGSLSLHMSRLEEEYTKSLQKISHHTEEYVTRLRDESKLVSLLTKMQSYFEREGMTAEAAQMAELHLEHIYYRHDTIAHQVDKAAEFHEIYGEVNLLHPACVSNHSGTTDSSTSHPGAISGKPMLDDTNSTAAKADYSAIMNELCTYVYKNGTEQAKKRATICHVYHHALHDRFLDARDLLLMSHLQENIYDVGDITTMIMFNRMMAQLGMCAFRQGKIWEAHQCLTEISSGKVRELLAQGMSMSRFNDKTPEQEKAEKRRQVPYYQHINVDLLEACHLISAMLLEVPNMAAASVGGDASQGRRARPISRAFRKHQDIYSHQVFTGPPEQTRDFVMRASIALAKGDWKSCVELCTSLDVWNLVPGDGAADSIKTMLGSKIKLEGLRTYLFAFSAQYDSLSLNQLCAMFEMSKNEVHSVVSKMMINRELYASWDQPTETIVLRKVEPSPVQVMALQFAEKASHLVEANERLLDATSGNKDDYWKGGRGDHQEGDRFGNRGSRGGQQQQGGGFNRGGRQSSGGRNQRRDGGTKGRGRSGGRKSGGRGSGGSGGQRRGNRKF
jgi:translation initiation factor 3 subunit C